MKNFDLEEFENYCYFFSLLFAIDLPPVYVKYKGKYFNQFGEQAKEFKLHENARMTTVPKEYRIYVDLDKFDDKELMYVCLAHEMRHIYQVYAITHLDEEVEHTRVTDVWSKEIKQYSNSSVQGYENQSIELDANAFAMYFSVLIFNREISVNCDQKLLKKAYQHICMDIPVEEFSMMYNEVFGDFPNYKLTVKDTKGYLN